MKQRVDAALTILMGAVAMAEPIARTGRMGKNSQKIAMALAALRAAIAEVTAEPPAPKMAARPKAKRKRAA